MVQFAERCPELIMLPQARRNRDAVVWERIIAVASIIQRSKIPAGAQSRRIPLL